MSAAMNETTKQVESITSSIKKQVELQLRKEFPFMQLAAVGSIVSACSEIINDGVEKQRVTMASTKQHCGFMRFSPELRNRVYELALLPSSTEDKRIYMGSHPRDCNENDRLARYNEGTTVISCSACHYDLGTSCRLSKPPALLRVSRQIREEAFPVYYGRNNFQTHIEYRDSEYEFRVDDNFPKLEDFALHVGEGNMALIKRLDILTIEKDLSETCVLHSIARSVPSLNASAIKCFWGEWGYFDEEIWVESDKEGDE